MPDRRLRMIHGSAEFGETVIATLDATTVRVHVSDCRRWSHQVLAEALVDLLGRLFPRILSTGCGDSPLHEWMVPGEGGSLLVERLEAVRSHGIAPLKPGAPDVTVIVGADGPGDVYCDGNGWQAYLGPDPSELEAGDAPVPIGPLAAACRAAARVFAIVLALAEDPPSTLERVYWSALTYEHAREPLTDIDLGAAFTLNAVLAGAGSVGGAAAYALARTPGLAGHLDIVDPQALEPHNPDRALLATEQLAAARAVKAIVVESALTHLPLTAQAHAMRIEEWVASRPRDAGLPLTLCSFDSVEARRELQDCLPLDVINAACGQDTIMVSAHRTGTGACLYCLYIATILDTERITFRLIVEATGLAPGLVQGLLEQHAPLSAQHLEEIERNRGLTRRALAAYAGRSLDELYRGALMYGEREIAHADNAAAVATPFVTALAGVLMAGEALKSAGGSGYEAFRLGPWSAGRDRYDESLTSSAADSFTSAAARWPDDRCLCNSTRRQRLLLERYDL